ncbi:unnamed protein product [Amoebophrya sp. A25]|nr:unnamed protein product [Amoebophrya sp. A25]|eukprot:GSA25T00008630001.1
MVFKIKLSLRKVFICKKKHYNSFTSTRTGLNMSISVNLLIDREYESLTRVIVPV